MAERVIPRWAAEAGTRFSVVEIKAITLKSLTTGTYDARRPQMPQHHF
jgi:hypothetical protein